MADKQIKSRKRVRDYGEVFTRPDTVSDMVDLVDRAYQETGEQDAYHILIRRWLEPACGNGNFLVEVLKRKFAICETANDGVVAVATLYGIDIQEDNVIECRERLKRMFVDRFGSASHLVGSIDWILKRNIVAGNFLTKKLNTEEPIPWLQYLDDEQLSLFARR